MDGGSAEGVVVAHTGFEPVVSALRGRGQAMTVVKAERQSIRDPVAQAVYRSFVDEIVAGPDEQMIRVNVSGRYYSPGYEVGDLPFLVGLAEWLERAIPGAEVWYGGDSVFLLPFDKERRAEYMDHFSLVK